MAVTDITRFGIQRKIVANMTSQSWTEIPHVSYIFEPDITDFQKKYKEFNNSLPEDKKITLNTVILRAVAEALKAAPQMNAHLLFERMLVRGKLTQFDNIDVSLPWILPNGEMMTINLKDVGNRSLSNLQDYIGQTGKKIEKTNLEEAMYSVSMHDTIENLKKGHFIKVVCRLIGSKTGNHKIHHLTGEAKKEYDSIPDSEKITRKELEQGTITISNIGSISRGIPGDIALIMIIPPQICAIGIGAIQKRPIVVTNEKGEDEIKIAQVLPMCVCFDHRALDFGEIKPFLTKLKELFDNPEDVFSL